MPESKQAVIASAKPARDTPYTKVISRTELTPSEYIFDPILEPLTPEEVAGFNRATNRAELLGLEVTAFNDPRGGIYGYDAKLDKDLTQQEIDATKGGKPRYVSIKVRDRQAGAEVLSCAEESLYENGDSMHKTINMARQGAVTWVDEMTDNLTKGTRSFHNEKVMGGGVIPDAGSTFNGRIGEDGSIVLADDSRIVDPKAGKVRLTNGSILSKGEWTIDESGSVQKIDKFSRDKGENSAASGITIEKATLPDQRSGSIVTLPSDGKTVGSDVPQGTSGPAPTLTIEADTSTTAAPASTADGTGSQI